jgi:molybdate transport system substrate-binding protein
MVGASVLALALAVAGCHRAPERPILLFAAASLEDAVMEAGAAYTARSGKGVAINTAGSNVLAKQIQAGAPADVFVSADARWVDDLIAAGSLDRASRRELLTNRLVVIAHRGSPYSLIDLAGLGSLPFSHLSLADPDSVPAGRYARSLLEHTPSASGTAWDAVESRVAPAPDVRAALAMVAAEPGAVGIVYRSDLTAPSGAGAAGTTGRGASGVAAAPAAAPGQGGAAHDVVVLLQIDHDLDPPIRYVGALVARATATPGAADLLDFLAGDEAGAIFERHGFLSLRPTS